MDLERLLFTRANIENVGELGGYKMKNVKEKRLHYGI